MYAENLYVEKYIDEMTELLSKAHPNWDEDKLRKKIIKLTEKRCQNPPVVLDNNYTHERKESSLLSVFEWAVTRKPIIAGNGTFYKNQNEELNPCAMMLINILGNRSNIKGMMFAIENVYSYEYAMLDRGQGNEKKRANSYYGAGGTKGSRFYSKWSAPATTLTAQSIISTTEQLFESFLVDNYDFLDCTECAHWIYEMLKDYNEKNDNLNILDELAPVTKDELVTRFYNHIIEHDEEGEMSFLRNIVKNLSKRERTFLFYKNNFMQFIYRNNIISDLVLKILTSIPTYTVLDENDPDWRNKVEIDGDFAKCKEYNKKIYSEMFFNPNKAPKSVKPLLEELSKYIMSYVYSPYIAFDKIYRLRNFKRKVVTVIDTDSNILVLDLIIDFFTNKLIKENNINLDSRPLLFNLFAMVNTLTYLITDAVNSILLLYGEHGNIPEEYRSRLNMKNEFFMYKLFISEVKKRYISQILLREGNMLTPPKIDVKGFDFKKSNNSQYVQKICMTAINEYLIKPDGFNIDGLIKYLYKFKKEVEASIMSGDCKFLPRGNAKELAAYKNPEREESIRGVYTWNIVNPDNAIELPAKVSLVKLKIFKETDMETLQETYPDIYQKLRDGIFYDKTGMFNTYTYIIDRVEEVSCNDKDWLEHIPPKYKKDWKDSTPEKWNTFVKSYNGKDKFLSDKDRGHWDVKIRGAQALAIPNGEDIPDWCKPYIDINYTVNKIVSPVISITKMFDNQTISEGKMYSGVNRKANAFTNIIKL